MRLNSMNKDDLNNNIELWINNSVPKIHNANIKKIFINENVSKISELENFIFETSFFDFIVDYTVLVEVNEKYYIGLIQKFRSAISLKDIGIAQVYARLAAPLFYYLISPKGFSKEASFLFGNDDVCLNMLIYEDKYIVGCKIKDNAEIDSDSVLPLGKKLL